MPIRPAVGQTSPTDEALSLTASFDPRCGLRHETQTGSECDRDGWGDLIGQFGELCRGEIPGQPKAAIVPAAVRFHAAAAG